VGREPVWVLGGAALRALSESTVSLLERLHRESPLKAGVGREELRRRLFAHTPPAVFDSVLGRLAEAGVVRLGADVVAHARHAVTLTPDEERGRRALVDAALSAGLAGLDRAQVLEQAGLERAVVERVSRLLLSEGVLQRVGDSLLLHRDHLEGLKTRVRERWPAGSRLDVAELKEMTGLTRKYVIPLLEYLDRERVTRRSGADRLVL
jgi:selenocysteine-specific elongation factor